MQTETKKILRFSFVLPFLLFAGSFLLPSEKSYIKAKTPSSFEAYFAVKQRFNEEHKISSERREKLLQFAPKTPVAILYIHGLGASPGEGELVEQIAKKRKWNLYFMRLPGHGEEQHRQAEVSLSDYKSSVEEAYLATRLLGDQVVVMGSSFGGTLALWLSSQYSSEIDALVLVSPFLGFYKVPGELLGLPLVPDLVQFVAGNRKAVLEPENPSDRRLPGYEKFWDLEQDYRAMRPLVQLLDEVRSPHLLSRIQTPSMLFYFYKNEEIQDRVSAVPAQLSSFAYLHDPYQRSYAVQDGAHVLFSPYVDGNHEVVLQELERFFQHRFSTEPLAQNTPIL